MKQNSQNKLFSVFLPIFSLVLLMLIFVYQFFYYSPQMKIKDNELDKEIELSNTLLNKELYQQAVESYKELIVKYNISQKKKANIIYRIGTVYQDNIGNYAEALKYFYELNIIHPDFPMTSDTKKRIVACLERLDKSLDAQNELSRFTKTDRKEYASQDNTTIVAEIGERKITYGEFQTVVKRLPESIQKNLKTKEAMSEFLQEYIITELLYESAKRARLENDQEVQKAFFEAKKGIVVQKLLQDKIGKDLKDINPDDVQLYYQAKKENYKNEETGQIPPFSEIQERVLRDYLMEKQNAYYQNYVQQLMRAQNVRIYNDKL